MTVFLCENGFDGILCGVYDVYASRLGTDNCRLELADGYEPELFCDVREVPREREKAKKVAETVRRRMSEEACLRLYRVSLHKSAARADAILRFIALGLGCGSRILRMLQEKAVYEIFRMDRAVANEAHSLVEFAHFERLRSGLYYGMIGPENDVIELVAGHFADRFPDTDWLLCDEVRQKAALHSHEGALVIHADIEKEQIEALRAEMKKDPYTDLWKTFFHTIAIEERRNPKCQRNMLPLRYRKYITEFQ